MSNYNDNPNELSSETQKQKILKYLQEGETITQLEALKMFKCFRLASRMTDLKKLEVPFDSVMVETPTGKHVKAYYIPEAFAKKRSIDMDEDLKAVARMHAMYMIASV